MDKVYTVLGFCFLGFMWILNIVWPEMWRLIVCAVFIAALVIGLVKHLAGKP